MTAPRGGSSKRSLTTSTQRSAFNQKAFRLLRPSADRTLETRKQGPKLTAIEALKNGKNRFRPLGHRSVELRFDLCFQQMLMVIIPPKQVTGDGGKSRDFAG